MLLICDAEMNRAELMLALELKDRVNFRDTYLQPALELGLIEMTQPDSPRSPTQKYRLTTLGKQILASHR
ncbi:Fic family protein [Advenella alkanexedens]|uniref:Fic family protein n=1 Tax=Advenella alkanexedens TaxID=1481665 RepID=UPI0031B8479A